MDRYAAEGETTAFPPQYKYTKSLLYKKPSVVRFLRQALKLYYAHYHQPPGLIQETPAWENYE